jgi:hypothetical protein
MTKKALMLIALTVAVTSVSIDPSHARRRGGSSFVTKPATVPAHPAPTVAKSAPVATAPRKDDARSGTQLHFMPAIAVRPSSGQAQPGTPLAASASLAASTPVAATAPAAVSETAAQAMASAPGEAAKIKPASAPPLPRIPKQLADRQHAPQSAHRDTRPPSSRQVVLCFKTATGTCSRMQ